MCRSFHRLQVGGCLVEFLGRHHSGFVQVFDPVITLLRQLPARFRFFPQVVCGLDFLDPGATARFLALCPGSLADGLCLLQFGLHFRGAQHKQLLPFGYLLPLLDVHLFDAAGDF